MAQGGSLVWESTRKGEAAWGAAAALARKQIIDKKIRVFTLPGFKIAREATDRGDLQLRNAGAMRSSARSSPCRRCSRSSASRPSSSATQSTSSTSRKFGKLGDAVVTSNMEVMTKGFELVREIKVGEMEAADRSTLRGKALLPMAMPVSIAASEGCGTGCRTIDAPEGQPERTPFDACRRVHAMFRAKLGYNQPANAYAASGSWRPAAAIPRRSTSRAARRRSNIPENCTQCMECIAVCPDTALPNCSQDLDTILHAAVSNYVSDSSERQKMLQAAAEIHEADPRAECATRCEERQDHAQRSSAR